MQTNSLTSLTNGVFTNSQMNEFVQALVNGISPLTEFQAAQGGTHYATEALTGAIAVPNTSTVYQTNAVAGYVNNASTSSNPVGVYGSGRALVNSVKVWGINSVAMAGNGITGAQLISCEVDLNNNTGSDATSGQSNLMVGISIQSGGSNKGQTGLFIASSASGNHWQNGISVNNADTYGIKVASLGAGANPLILVPPDNTSALCVVGRNAADSATVWEIQNSGNIVTNGIMQGAFFQSPGANPAASGVLRLGSGDSIVFRNNANSGDVALGKNSSDNLTFPNSIQAASSILTASAPTVSAGQLGLGSTSGFGNGTAGTAMTTTTKSTGSGPTTPQTVKQYLQVNLGGTTYWIPMVQ